MHTKLVFKYYLWHPAYIDKSFGHSIAFNFGFPELSLSSFHGRALTSQLHCLSVSPRIEATLIKSLGMKYLVHVSRDLNRAIFSSLLVRAHRWW